MSRQTVKRKRGRAGQRQRRRRLLRSNGLCERCLERDITRAADVVDHIVPLSLGGSDEDANTRNLCDACHKAVTAEQFGFASIERGVDVDGRPTFADHPWNVSDPGGRSKV